MTSETTPIIFERGLCIEDCEEVQPRIIDNSPVCHNCVKSVLLPLFEQALQYEYHYPPSWGPDKLNIADFNNELGDDFLERYRRREKEYKTPTEKRVYCTHKIYAKYAAAVGGAAKLPLTKRRLSLGGGRLYEEPLVECGAMAGVRAESEAMRKVVTCFHCHGLVCDYCKAHFYDLSEGQRHICSENLAGGDLDRYKDLVRGKDYQRYPACQSPVELTDGCNHMTCLCKQQFCFICGAAATANSEHLNAGKPCPRWNQPGAHNAQHDDELEAFEDALEVPQQIEFPPRLTLEQVLEHRWNLRRWVPTDEEREVLRRLLERPVEVEEETGPILIEIHMLTHHGDPQFEILGIGGGVALQDRLVEAALERMDNILAHGDSIVDRQLRGRIRRGEQADYRERLDRILATMALVPEDVLRDRLPHLKERFDIYIRR